MRGDRVIVREYGERLLLRRVWEDEGATVLICDDETFRRLEGGDRAVWPVPFERTRVYGPYNEDHPDWHRRFDAGTWEGLRAY